MIPMPPSSAKALAISASVTLSMFDETTGRPRDNDSVSLLFVVAALALYLRGRYIWAFVALTVASLGKIWPVILFPFLALEKSHGRRRFHWKALLTCVPVALLQIVVDVWQDANRNGSIDANEPTETLRTQWSAP